MRSLINISVILGSLVCCGTAMCQPLERARVQERFLSIASQDTTLRLLLQPPDIQTQSYLTSLELLPPLAREAAGQRAILTYYRYAGNLTIRATIDQISGKVLKLEELQNYPAALAPEEIDRARRIAQQQVEKVRQLQSQYNGQLRVQALSAIVSKRSDPAFNHRVALLVYLHGETYLGIDPVKVDLSTGTVIRSGGGTR